jgi:hypothetical protein
MSMWMGKACCHADRDGSRIVGNVEVRNRILLPPDLTFRPLDRTTYP